MKFIVDAQLPPALASMIVDLGHEARHVVDIGLRDADDSPIWDYTVSKQAAVIRKTRISLIDTDREVKAL